MENPCPCHVDSFLTCESCCDCYSSPLYKEAPELLEILKEIIEIWTTKAPKLSPNYQLNWRVKGAIARAEGK